MLKPRDREYAGAVAGILLAARIVREGPTVATNADVVRECASAAVMVVQAVDRHLPPKDR